MVGIIQNRSITVVTAPSSEPITLADAKAFLKIQSNTTEDDTIIESKLIPAVRTAAERYMRRHLINTTLRHVQNSFEFNEIGALNLNARLAYMADLDSLTNDSPFIQLFRPVSPTTNSITSVKTYGLDNTSTTLSSDDYYLDLGTSRIVLNSTASTPSDMRQRSAIEVNYVAGYGTSSSAVPADIILGMFMHLDAIVSAARSNRDGQTYDMPEAAREIYSQYKNLAIVNV